MKTEGNNYTEEILLHIEKLKKENKLSSDNSIPEIIKRNPQLLNDIKLFKITLLPMQLYLLKYFFIYERPMNIREIYSASVFICFMGFFKSDYLNDTPYYPMLFRHLFEAGYGYGYIDDKEGKEVLKRYTTEYPKQNPKSKTEQLSEFWFKELKNHNVKAPSYDKFKKLFEDFEALGILIKKGKEGKGIYYAFNPTFYSLFRSKKELIINL